jgi:type IV pilus assembly protein PilB
MSEEKAILGLLLKRGFITDEQANAVREDMKQTGLSVERTLEKFHFINEEEVANIRASALGVPYIDLSDYIIDTALVKLISETVASKYKTVPLFKIGDTLTVAMVDPKDIAALDQIRKITNIDIIDSVLASEKGIKKIIDSYYGFTGSIVDLVRYIDDEKLLEAEDQNLLEVAEETPIIKIVNIIIMQAIKDRASDIHVEPEEHKLRIRYRIDGILHEVNTLPRKLQRAIISRIKILSKLDISENRRPQDGKIRLRLEDKDLDIRVSTFPTTHGENVVMRLLNKSSVLLGLKDLGLSEEGIKSFDRLIRHPNGIILVTGPTGSGKTTTLYAALCTINSLEKNIITIEDPVEYELPLIRQTMVNPKVDLTFANGLRSILRQDPDIVMVGEIRDKETAEIAIQASLTGHLVFSTLHTNDAASALTRLIDMGIEPFLISSSVIGILAQRLVRLICRKCVEKYSPSPTVLKELGIDAKQEFFRGKGCGKCNHTGFLGRIGIFELLTINEEIRSMVDAKKSADQVKKKALEMGMRTLLYDGLEKVKNGLTTVEEVLRVAVQE